MTPIVSPQPVTYGQDASWARFSVHKYQQMIETGILNKEDKVELLEGYVVLKMPRHPRRDSKIQRIQKKLYTILPNGWDVRTQLAITLADSQPEPDFAIVRGDATNYESNHPGPSDIGFLIEVADSSLLRDQRDKTRIYARAGIVCYWIINLPDTQIEVFTQPSGITYNHYQIVRVGDMLPINLDGIAVGPIAVSDLLL